MIKKIGKLSIDYNRIISYFESADTVNNSTYVSPRWTVQQKDKLIEKGHTEQQINEWSNYKYDSTTMEYLSGNEIIKKYILTNLDAAFLLEHQLDRNIIGWNIQKQMPGHFTIPHYDLYSSITNTTEYKSNQVIRCWIPLQDAKFGHALFVNGVVLSDFKEGEIYDWDIDDLHAAVNVGFDPRYTLLLYFSKKSI